MTNSHAKSDKVGFIGLGAMGSRMALQLVEAGMNVTGFDVKPDGMVNLREAGGHSAESPGEAAEGAGLAIVMVLSADQVDDVLLGKHGAIEAMPSGGTVMVCSTVSPNYIRALEAKLRKKNINLLDAPVSGGTVGAEAGALTVMASGCKKAFKAANPALDAIAGKVYRLGDDVGIGSTVKMINQLLAGVHIAAAGEAMALGTRAGADPQTLYDVISNSAGSSWMFQNRVPHMIEGDYTPLSSLNIFVKDLGIVLDYGKEARFPLPLTAAAHQMYLMGAAAGMGGDDDSSIVRIFEQIAGIQVSANGNGSV